jgi:hypothetical protein
MTEDTRVFLNDIKNWFYRCMLTALAMFIGISLFANWRYFPSFEPHPLSRDIGPILFTSIRAGIFHLLPAMGLLVIIRQFKTVEFPLAVDVLYVVLFLATPLLLNLLPCGNSFSFGVSEGEIIHNCVRTELGWKYLYMTTARQVFLMTIYLALRFWLWKRFPKAL